MKQTITLFQVTHSDEGQYVFSLSSSLHPNDETKTLHVTFNITVETDPPTTPSNDAMIAGIAVGSVVFLVAVVVLAVVCLRRRGKKGYLQNQYIILSSFTSACSRSTSCFWFENHQLWMFSEKLSRPLSEEIAKFIF